MLIALNLLKACYCIFCINKPWLYLNARNNFFHVWGSYYCESCFTYCPLQLLNKESIQLLLWIMFHFLSAATPEQGEYTGITVKHVSLPVSCNSWIRRVYSYYCEACFTSCQLQLLNKESIIIFHFLSAATPEQGEHTVITVKHVSLPVSCNSWTRRV